MRRRRSPPFPTAGRRAHLQGRGRDDRQGRDERSDPGVIASIALSRLHGDVNRIGSSQEHALSSGGGTISYAERETGSLRGASYGSVENNEKMAIQFPVPLTQRHPAGASRASLVLPEAVCGAVLRALDMAADRLVLLGISANFITAFCIGLGVAGGVLLGLGHFGLAAIAMIVASLGDALDGLVARRGNTVSVAGALLDASGDRYQEFFFLGGLAVYLRGCTFGLIATLLALAGSFMVSYSSAKAEALGVPVPPGVMRRPERAVCMCVATALMTPWALLTANAPLPIWVGALPMIAAVSLIAVVGNASAISRLHSLARRKPTAARFRASMRSESNGVGSPSDSPNGAVQAHALRGP